MDVASLRIAIQTGDIKKAEQELGKLEGASKKAERATDSLTQGFDNLATTLRTYLGLQAGMKVVRLSDEYTKFTAQLKLATTSQDEYNEALDAVRRISTDAQSSLTGTAVLFARITNGTRELGISQQKVSDITETVSLALKVSGATAEESASAMLQLSQAFASGVLRGEEFNAVNEAAPRLMKALADGMGVPIGQLRRMAAEGLITSDVMAKALPQALGQLRKESDSIQTISGAFQVLNNIMLESVGSAAQATGASKGLADGISSMAEQIGASQIAFKAATVLFQTLGVVGSDVVFVFKGVGREIGAIAAQIAALGRGDFNGFKAISEAVKEDARIARLELDEFQERLFNLSVPQVDGGSATQAVRKMTQTLSKEELKERQKIEDQFNDERIKSQRQRIIDENEARQKADDEYWEGQKTQAKQVSDFLWQEAERRVQEDLRATEEIAKVQIEKNKEQQREDKQRATDMRRDLSQALQRAFESGKNPAEALIQGFASTMFARLSTAVSDALADAAIQKLGFSSGGSGGGFGGLIDKGISAIGSWFGGLSFEGGGSTGSGSRSGGMDGRGGFMAMLHPNETVIDHSQGGGMGQIVYAPVIQVDSRTDRGEVQRLVNQAVQNGNAQLVDRLQRQGRI